MVLTFQVYVLESGTTSLEAVNSILSLALRSMLSIMIKFFYIWVKFEFAGYLRFLPFASVGWAANREFFLLTYGGR